MSTVKQGHCPRCPSSDAYTQYPDGSAFCFSCGKYFPAELSLQSIKKRLVKIKVAKEMKELPHDVQYSIPKEPLAWLKSYGLSSQEIQNNKYMWSPSTHMLIVVSVDSEQNVIFWQGRFFPKQEPKVIGFGQKDHLKFGGTETGLPDVLIVVEDFVSAIKVNRFQTCLCLFGSHIPPELVLRLRKLGYKKLVIWLDPNKSKESLSFSRRYSTLFSSGCTSIISTKDPKEHSNNEIQEYLNKVLT